MANRNSAAMLRLGSMGLLALVIGGCGGGGGGGVAPPSQVAVTAANQDAVARAGMVGIQGGLVGGSLGLAGGGQSSPMSAAAGPGLQRALALATKTALAAAGRKNIAAVSGLTENCAVSGSFTGTVDDRDNSQSITSGDVLNLTFNNCSEVAGETISGGMGATYTQVVRSPLTVGAAVTVSNLNFVEAATGYSAGMDGGFNFSYSEISTTVSTTRMVVPGALALRAVTATFNDTVTLLDGYTVDSSYDSASLPPGGTTPGRTTSTATGPVASSAAGGFVRMATPVPLVQYDVDSYPRSGVVTATGTSGALRATVLSSTQVQMDLDADGNGNFEATKTVAWALLL